LDPKKSGNIKIVINKQMAQIIELKMKKDLNPLVII